MILQLKIVGVLLLLMALLHAGFPRYFNWVGELKSLSLINRQMMYIHTLFIALVLLLMGLLCLSCASDLITTELGRKVALGLSAFWLARLLVQFFGYSADLWRGKPFETTIHVIFSLLWTYLTIVFGLVFWQ
jgi:hypothetical protein